MALWETFRYYRVYRVKRKIILSPEERMQYTMVTTPSYMNMYVHEILEILQVSTREATGRGMRVVGILYQGDIS